MLSGPTRERLLQQALYAGPQCSERTGKIESIKEDAFNQTTRASKVPGKVGPDPLQTMCRGFLLYNFLRILPGIFLEDFSGHFFSVAMPADSRREKIFDFVREFAVKYFRIVLVRDSTQQNKA